MADNDTYNDAIARARLAEDCERYADMAVHMVEAVKANGYKLDQDGRTLFQIAFKNEIGARRTSLRNIPPVDSEEGVKKQHIKDIKQKIIEELEKLCGDVLAHIKTLLENCPKPEEIKGMEDSAKKEAQEDKINYLKMIGDYNRYRAEYLEGEKRENVKTAASEAYGKAVELAKDALEETDPTRLGLMLNFSVFNYEVMKETEKACSLAKDAFDQAIAKLDSLSDNSYKDSTLIMQLLRDNLTLWTSENDDNNNAGD
jgi:hypothetical protein